MNNFLHRRQSLRQFMRKRWISNVLQGVTNSSDTLCKLLEIVGIIRTMILFPAVKPSLLWG